MARICTAEGRGCQMAGKSQNQFVKTGMNETETVGEHKDFIYRGNDGIQVERIGAGLYQSLQLFSLLQ